MSKRNFLIGRVVVVKVNFPYFQWAKTEIKFLPGNQEVSACHQAETACHQAETACHQAEIAWY